MKINICLTRQNEKSRLEKEKLNNVIKLLQDKEDKRKCYLKLK